MKKLFEVSIEKTIYVLAEDEHEAELEAKTYEGEEEADNLSIREVMGSNQIPREYMDTLPYGDHEGKEMTLAEIMEQPPPPAPYVDPPEQLRMFPETSS